MALGKIFSRLGRIEKILLMPGLTRGPPGGPGRQGVIFRGHTKTARNFTKSGPTHFTYNIETSKLSFHAV